MAKAAKAAKVAKVAKVAKAVRVRWLEEPADKDYLAAESYLSLVADSATVKKIVAKLRKAPASVVKAKDIMRASRLPLLPPDDVLVAKDMAKARARTPLSPILLVRGDLAEGLPLQIADGYHRACACYHFGDDSEVPCRIAELEDK